MKRTISLSALALASAVAGNAVYAAPPVRSSANGKPVAYQAPEANPPGTLPPVEVRPEATEEVPPVDVAPPGQNFSDGSNAPAPFDLPQSYPSLSRIQLPGIRGFGLMQRERQAESYRDGEAKYHLRPHVWIEPKGAWTAGSIELYGPRRGRQVAAMSAGGRRSHWSQWRHGFVPYQG